MLDTPIHTATFMSMLFMAKQLAVAEAEQQQQQQHECADSTTHGPFTALHPTALLQLRLARQQRTLDEQQQQPEQRHQQQQCCSYTYVGAVAYSVLCSELRCQHQKVLHVVMQQPPRSLVSHLLGKGFRRSWFLGKQAHLKYLPFVVCDTAPALAAICSLRPGGPSWTRCIDHTWVAPCLTCQRRPISS